MPTLPVAYSEIRRTVDTWHEVLAEGFALSSGQGGPRGAIAELADRIGLDRGNSKTAAKRLDIAVALGIVVRDWRPVDGEWAREQLLRYRTYDEEYRSAQVAPQKAARAGHPSAGAASPRPTPDRHKPQAQATPLGYAPTDQGAASAADRGESFAAPVTSAPITATPEQMIERVVALLRKGPMDIGEIAQKLGLHIGTADDLVETARRQGTALVKRDGRWHLDTAPPLGSQVAHDGKITSDRNGIVRFAACGDMHLCSKYARLDCLNEFYDEVERRGISLVLNTGNWIDGEAPFNKHDLLVHGIDAQMRFLAEHYPQRPGVQTWAITGADHEGWYARREGVDVGRYAARVMTDAGRDDWRDMGYMECFIPVVHLTTGKSSQLCLMHPGGGSAYALSYAPQKIVEGFDGGDKPAVLLIGHYHKSGYNLIRNVHTAQTGCFQDQTVWMRQQKLSAHLGGCFMELRLDPDTGAVIECSYAFRNYFVRSYYSGRWSQHGPVVHAHRAAAVAA